MKKIIQSCKRHLPTVIIAGTLFLIYRLLPQPADILKRRDNGFDAVVWPRSPLSSRQDPKERNDEYESDLLNVTTTEASLADYVSEVALSLKDPVEAEQEERQQHISEWCKKSWLTSLAHKTYIIDHRHHVLFCGVPKVATSSWRYTLGRIAGAPEESELHVQTPEYLNKWGYVDSPDFIHEVPGPNHTVIPYKSFTFYRHPLARLLSTYREKFTTHNQYSNDFQARFGTAIIKLVRPNATEESKMKGQDVTFHEFVQFLILEARVGHIADTHWSPQYQHCNPCHHKLDFIGKIESNDDVSYVLKHFFNETTMGLGAKNTMKTQLGSSGESVMKQYYDTIPPDDLEKIIQIYRPDFELMGYPEELPL